MLLLMNSEAIEMKRTKTVELFSYIKAEYIKAAENFQHISSDYYNLQDDFIIFRE